MALLTDELKAYIGVAGPIVSAAEPVEAGAVRRYAQAIMDEDMMFAPVEAGGGGLAPPLFPINMFRRPMGTPDPVVERAHDPDYDGSVGSSMRGLPELPTRGLVRLNGGSEIEILAYVRHGARITMQARYSDMRERETSKGPMIIVTLETNYSTEDGETVLRVRTTTLLRKASA